MMSVVDPMRSGEFFFYELCRLTARFSFVMLRPMFDIGYSLSFASFTNSSAGGIVGIGESR
jgi:hypothetical protein